MIDQHIAHRLADTFEELRPRLRQSMCCAREAGCRVRGVTSSMAFSVR
jgi:hypothetical protein